MEKLSRKITSFFIAQNYVAEEKREMYDYCFEILLATLVNLIAISIIGIIAKEFILTIIYIVTFMTMRNFGGGYHANRHITCILTSIIIFMALLIFSRVFAEYLQTIGYIGILLSYIIIWINGPVDNKNKPLSDEEKKYLKKRLFVALSIFSVVGALLLYFQPTITYGFTISYVLIIMSIGGTVGRIKNGAEK